MSFKDQLVGSAINKAQNELQGNQHAEESTQGENKGVRFLVSVIWVILAMVFTMACAGAMGMGLFERIISGGGKGLFVFAIGGSFLFALITFLVPYLRKKGTMTRWCGVVALGDALWWIYILLTH